MWKDLYKKILNKPSYLGLFVLGIIFFILILSYFVNSGSRKSETQIKQGQIQIVKGDEVITINENGLVEYKSKDRVYTETWDTSQISSFFSMMERKARDFLSKKVSGGDCGYKVFMFIDGKLVTICVDSNDSDLAVAVESIFIKYSEINLSDYFGDTGSDTGGDQSGDFDGVITFPTPTLSAPLITPTPTTSPGSGTNTNYEPVKVGCEAWSGDIVKDRAIISNTYCTTLPTSTPTP